MIAFVKKANNRYKAVPQRDAVNKIMNLELRPDGSFDFDDMIKNHPAEFHIVLSIMYYQLTKDSSKIAPPEINVMAAAKYEGLFVEMADPIFHAIKNAIASGKDYTALYLYKVKSFFLTRATLIDLPDELKKKAIEAARIAHGENYDVTSLKNNEAKLNTILDRTGYHSIMFFNMTTFEFSKH